MFINHCHVAPQGVFEKEFRRAGFPDRMTSESGTLENLSKLTKLLTIEKAIAFAPFPYQIPTGANDWLCDSLKNYPNIKGFATLNPKETEAPLLLDYYIGQGLVGCKIHPPIFKVRINDPALDHFYAKAQKLKIPLLFHTGVHGWQLNQYIPLLLDEVAQKFPSLKIIIEHMGGIAFFDQALAVLQNNPNCYAGITGILSHSNPGYHIPNEKINLLIETIGSDRIIYGLDYPYGSLENWRKEIEIINAWKISEDDKLNILGRTLERVIDSRK